MSKAPAEPEWRELPTIIVDPSLLAADSPPVSARPRAALTTLAQGFAAAIVIVVTVTGVSLSDFYLRLPSQPKRDQATTPQGPCPQPEHQRQAQRPVGRETVLGSAVIAPSVMASALADVGRPAKGPEQPQQLSALAQSPNAGAGEAMSGGLEVDGMQTLLREGRRYLSIANLEKAELRFRGVLTARPNHPGALAGLARIAIQRGDPVGAVALARRAVHAAPAHAFYHSLLGDALRQSGEPAGADMEYETAAKLSAAARDRARILPPNPYLEGS